LEDDRGLVRGQTSVADAPLRRFAWVCVVVLVGVVPVATTNLSLLGAGAPLTADQFQLPKFAVILTLTAVASAAVLWDLATRGSPIWWDRTLWVLVGLVVWTLLTSVFSVDWRTSLGGAYARYEGVLGSVVYAALVLTLVQLVRSAGRVRLLSAVTSASGALVATYALVQTADLDPVSWGTVQVPGANEVFGTYGNADLLAGFLVFPLVLCAGLALSESRDAVRVAYWGGFVVIAAAIVASTVRGAWIGAIAGVAVLVALAWSAGARPRRLDAIALAVGLAGGVVLVAATGTATRVVERTAAILSPAGTVAQRIDVWQVAVRAALARPFAGWGPDAFGWAFARSFGDEFVRTWGEGFVVDAAHNQVLQLAITLGVLGAALYVAFAVGVLWVSMPSRRTASGQSSPGAPQARLPVIAVWAAVVGLLAYLLSGVAVPGVSLYLWVGLGLLVATRARPLAAEPSRTTLMAAAVGASVLLLAAVAWSATTLNADRLLARGLTSTAAADKTDAFDRAVGANPLGADYQYRRADSGLDRFRAATGLGQDGTAAVTAFEKTRVDVEEAVERFRADPRNHVTQATLLNEATAAGLGDFSAEAASAARRGLDASPSDPRALYQLAVATARTGDLEGAEAILLRLVDMTPDSLRVRLLLGDVYATMGDDARAAEQYDAARAIDPSDPDVRSRFEEER
jgi:O-antigen ligase